MAIRPIVTYPNPVLKQRCAPVTEFDDALGALIDDMLLTMDDADGLGLAANQIGEPVRIFTMSLPVASDRGEGDDGEGGDDGAVEKFEIINPEIISRRGEIRFEEGCLSFPGVSESVKRSAFVRLRYQDRTGATIERDFHDLGAVCVQHEFDHLEGITFLDRLSRLKHRLAMRAYNRAMAEARLDAEDEGRAAVRPWR